MTSEKSTKIFKKFVYDKFHLLFWSEFKNSGEIEASEKKATFTR